jgi:glucokinase
LAMAALERFCLLLGAFAGDVALMHRARAVVIAGGLGLRLREHLLLPAFGQRFVAKGRFVEMMNLIPVKLITHPQPGLLGAAAAFARNRMIEG